MSVNDSRGWPSGPPPLPGRTPGTAGGRTPGPTPAAAVNPGSHPTAPLPPPGVASAGRMIGRYAVTGEVGRGGMGLVLRGWDPHLRREVAIKLVGAGAEVTDRERERFRREAQVSARLRHPAIVSVHEVGEHEGRPFLVMDLIDGETLEAAWRRRRPPPRVVAEVTRQIALALEYAHGEGVIHRDVKPQNVLVDAGGRPYLVDFGLARALDAPGLTRSGQLIGTPHYVSPEQARGERDAVGPNLDIHCLGGLLYFGLVGRPPYDGETLVEVVRRLLTTDPEPPRRLVPTIHADLETITLKCLEKEPDRRYATAAQLAADLQRFLDGEAILARPVGRAGRLRRWGRRNRALAAGAVALAVVLVASVVAVGVMAGRMRGAARQARGLIVEGARADLERARETLARVRAEQPPADAVPEKLRAHQDRLLAAALDVMQGALALRQLDLGDEAARREAFEAVMDYGALAVAARQWSVAAGAFEKAAALDVDDARAEAARVASERERALLESERRAAVEAVLERVRSGELDQVADGIEDAVFELVRLPDGQTVALLGRALDDVSRALRESTTAAYLSVVELTAEERADGVAPIEGLREAVGRLRVLGEAERVAPADAELFRRARQRLVDREVRRRPISASMPAPSPQAILAARQQLDLGRERLLVARVCCEALGRIGIHSGAVEPLGRYVLAEQDELRAVPGGRALLRLGGERARRLLDAAERRFGRDGPFTEQLESTRSPSSQIGSLGGGGISVVSRVDELLAQGRTAAALSELDRRLRDEPDSAALLTKRGQVHAALGDHERAVADFERVVALRPDDAHVFSNLGAARLHAGDADGSIAALRRAVALDERLTLAWSNLGGALCEAGRLEEAEEALGRSLELDPRNPSAWNNRASVRADRGNVEGALADFARSLELEPREASTWNNRGTIYKNAGDLVRAIEDFDRALELDPALAAAWANRGSARLLVGDAAGARSDLDRAIELAPSAAMAWSARGSARWMLGDAEGARTDLDRALELDPDDVGALGNRAILRVRLRDVAGALADLERALALDPEAPKLWGTLGMLRANGGDVEGALEAFDRAVALAPDEPRFRFTRAVAREAAGDAAGAIEDLRAFLEKAPPGAQRQQAERKLRELEGAR